MIYKVKLSVYEDEETCEGVVKWTDFYLDVTTIVGFRVHTDKNYPKGATFIYVQGDLFIIKNEPHIMEYLLKNFVEKAIENE